MRKKSKSSLAGSSNGLQNPVYLENYLTIAFDAVVAFDSQKRITIWNPAAETMYGWTADEALGKAPTELFGPVETLQGVGNVRQDLLTLEKGEIIGGEYTPLRKDGSSFWVEYSAREILDEDGRVSGYISVHRDITERKRAEEELRSKESELKNIINHTPFMLTRCSRDLHYRFVSRAYAEMIGRAPEEIAGKQIVEIMGEQGLKTVAPYIEQVLQGHQVEYESEVSFQGASRPFLHAVYTPDRDEHGNVIGWFASIVDITERKQAERALRQSEERFVQFMQHLPGLAWIKDMKGRYVYANAAAERAFKTPAEKLYGKTDHEVFTPEVAAQFRKNDELALVDGSGVQVVETLAHDDGLLHYSLVSKFPIPGPDGTTALVGGIAFDITERLRAEAALRESEARLRAVFDGTYEYIGLLSPDGTLLEANRAALEFDNNTRQDVVGRPFWETSWWLHTPGAPEALRKAIEHAASGEFIRYEAPLNRRSGETIIFDFSLHPVRDEHGKVVFLVPEGRNITERKQAEAQIEAQRRHLQVLADSSRVFAEAGPDYQSVLDAIVNQMGQLIGDACTLRLPSQDGQTHVLAAVYHPDPEARAFYQESNSQPLRPDEGTSGRVFISGQPIFMPVVTAAEMREASPPRFWSYLERFPIHSGMAVPLRVQGRTIGTLSLWRDVTPQAYTEDDLHLVMELADRAGLAIENALLYDAEQEAHRVAQRAAERTSRLQQITAAISRAATTAQLAETVLQQGVLAAGANAGILVQLLENGQEIKTVAAIGYPPEAVPTQPVPLSTQTPMSDGIRLRQAVWIRSHEDLAEHYPQLAHVRRGFGNESTASIPLITGNRVLGGLAFSFVEPREFDREEQDFFLAVAQQCAQGLERAQAEEALREHEKQLQELNETLERRVKERTAEVQRLASDLTRAEQRERHRIAHILHDDLQQRLYAIQMQMTFLHGGLPIEDATVERELADIRSQLDDVLAVTRHLSIDLSPPILRDEGLAHAIGWLGSQMEEQHGLRVDLRAAGSFALPDEDLQVLLFNCVRELLFNIVKHADVHSALVALEWTETGLRIEVRDEGKGFRVNMPEPYIFYKMAEDEERPSFGLPTIRHRLNLLGGRMEVKAEPGSGTQVILNIPVFPDGLRTGEPQEL